MRIVTAESASPRAAIEAHRPVIDGVLRGDALQSALADSVAL